ncbi:hypothetical protein D3C74_439880 [compost metagenome]
MDPPPTKPSTGLVAVYENSRSPVGCPFIHTDLYGSPAPVKLPDEAMVPPPWRRLVKFTELERSMPKRGFLSIMHTRNRLIGAVHHIG